MKKEKINDSFNNIEITKQYGFVYGFNIKKAIIWYNIAEENLTTSKVLLDNHRFAHAAFFMQQCIECFMKGILIHSDIIPSNNVKYISHNMKDVICEFYRKVGDEYNLKTIQSIHSKLQNYESFSDRCAMVIIPCVNDLIQQFNQAVKEQTFGTHTIYGYINNLLILLSLLLNQDIQQSTRYYENNSYPYEKYTSNSQLDKILVYLQTVNKWVKFLVKEE